MKTKREIKTEVIIFFKSLLRPSGRINRRRYIVTSTITIFLLGTILALEEMGIINSDYMIIYLVTFIFKSLILGIFLTESAKRSHDINQSGTFIIIPFFVIALIFKKGDKTTNAYGTPPNQPK